MCCVPPVRRPPFDCRDERDLATVGNTAELTRLLVTVGRGVEGARGERPERCTGRDEADLQSTPCF